MATKRFLTLNELGVLTYTDSNSKRGINKLFGKKEASKSIFCEDVQDVLVSKGNILTLIISKDSSKRYKGLKYNFTFNKQEEANEWELLLKAFI